MPRFVEKPMYKGAGWRLPLSIFEGEIEGNILRITAPEELMEAGAVHLVETEKEASTGLYPTIQRSCLIEIPSGHFGLPRLLTYEEWLNIMDILVPGTRNYHES